MRDELKKKIEQINMGLTPKGYKKVKFKIVPSDWKSYSIHEVCEVVNGGTPSTKNKEYWNGNIPWCTPTDITKSPKYISKTEKTITEQGLNNSSTVLLPKNSILMTSRATIGPRSINLVEMTTNQGFKSFICRNDKLDYEFFYYLLEIYIPYFRKLGSGSTFIEVSKKDVENTIITVPASLEEQKVISSILSTWDKAIELKEKLIEQKKEQKKGLMQKLLTGEVRLPGFDSKWSNVKIGNIIKEINEKSTVNNQFQVLSVTKDGIVSQSEHFKKQVASDNNIGYKIIRKNNLVFSTMNLWMGSLDVLTNYEVGLVSPAYKVFKFNDEVMDPIFGKYFMKTEHMIWLYNVNSEQGASVVRRNLDLKGLLNTYVNIPSLEEQRNIARVIFCLDTEIDLLEHETKQLIKQKKGLMQLLLTGKVRVKV